VWVVGLTTSNSISTSNTSEHLERKRSAYGSACSLDRAGRYAEADDVLRCADVPQEEIEQRRRHIKWRLGKGLSALDG
jgi:hypothetical protein